MTFEKVIFLSFVKMMSTYSNSPIISVLQLQLLLKRLAYNRRLFASKKTDFARIPSFLYRIAAFTANPVAGTYKKWCNENGKKYFSVASGGGTGRTLHPDNMAAGPASYGMTDTMGRMHGDAQFAGSSSVPAHVEMMGLIGAGNNPMVGMTVAVAVAIEEASK